MRLGKCRKAVPHTHGRAGEQVQPVPATHQRRGSASVGHVHLSVGDVATAREFYVNRLGFETTAQVGSSALFVSAGGYHHHMAMNSWNSAGAGKRRLALGLGLVRIEVPTDDDLHSLGDRLRHYGLDGRNDGRVLGFDDPWLNRIEVMSKAGG